jgi:hypothetical protein
MTAHTIKVTANEARIETTTPNLRFVQRGTSRVLQQLVTWVSSSGMTGGQEWRDVPLVAEGK